ncbi:hypothetical protein IW140_004390 [Coemansia sp. RSA 1813]|nr:hypothetical protein LPJ74_004037 [Coemansia sp. RSA 1843]KAJ2085560.1 hypothetical protein IW138_006255 [Coemansia sp. RSA 986]KAJ2212925.1 hypothetical protein EV179_004236 [Coemansia sp. RSA 487]KAJ2567600.1 hypothetical protein IW140_004390 [Coemansia sp. RSA 1813]
MDKIYSSVKDYYGKVLSTSKDLKTSACTAGSAPHPIVRDIIAKQVPEAVNEKFYGCGNPIPLGIGGMSVLDLGSGSGRDCYVAAALVGPSGLVTGVDMTDEQLEVARANIPDLAKALGFQPQLRFLTGYIEDLDAAGVARASIDLCISNCVINLSPAKPAVLRGVFDSLRDGGELYFSDVYADADLPADVRTHDVLLGECIGGALYTEEFEQISRTVGFAQPRVLSVAHIEINDPELKALVKDTRFYSITYRLFKISKADDAAAAAAATAVYKGTVPGHPDKYELDVDHAFAKDAAVAVDGTTAAILKHSWLSKYFDVQAAGDAAAATTTPSTTPTAALLQKAYDQAKNVAANTSGCCSGKKCC